MSYHTSASLVRETGANLHIQHDTCEIEAAMGSIDNSKYLRGKTTFKCQLELRTGVTNRAA
jgi:hypothetical protein